MTGENNENLKTLVCVAEKFIVGGVETYYMRMFKWAHDRGYRTILLLPENSFIAKEWNSHIEKEKVEVWFYTSNVFSVKLYDSSKNRVSFNKRDLSEKTIVCDNLHTYVAALYISQRFQWENASVLLYVLHHEMSRCSEKKIFNFGYRCLLIKKMINNGLIFMDEQTIQSFENYYGYKIDAVNATLRLGQEIPESFTFRERNREKFNILSVCRMDFPFKGYVLGLIDSYKKLKEHYPELKLTLIGNGPQYDKVLNKITEAGLKRDIHLLETVPYEELDRYIIDSDLCVGMGTSLLDAGKRGKIAIIATADQYLPLSCGYLFENPDKLGVFAGEQGWNRYGFEELIERVIKMDDAGFYDWCEKSYKVVKDHYDIGNIMEKLMGIKTRTPGRVTVCCIKIYDKFILSLKKVAGIG